jgi:Lrp/AsnC family transcriptional regulator
MNTRLDAIDRKILTELQRDATLSLAELGARAGVSATPCWTRVKRLEAAGILSGRVALLDRAKLGLGVTVFVSIRTSRHDAEWLEAFASGIRRIPEVVEFYRMAGEVDYLLKVVCADIADYDRIYQTMIRAVPLADVSSAFAMEQIKYTTEVPLYALP